jgi:hypothetical protein
LISKKKVEVDLTNVISIFNYNLSIDTTISPTFIKQSIFKNSVGQRFNVYIKPQYVDILDKIRKLSLKMGSISETFQGIIAGDEKKFISKTKETINHVPVLRGKHIKRYEKPIAIEYIYFIEGTKVLIRSRKKENFEKDEKILTQHVSGNIVATLDTDKNYYMQTINGTYSTDKEFSNKYILAFLNSKLLDFYYSYTFNLGAEFTTAVAIENINELPIIKASDEVKIEIENLIDSIYNSNDSNLRKEFELQIDKAIYELYKLSPTEIEIIENA